MCLDINDGNGDDDDDDDNTDEQDNHNNRGLCTLHHSSNFTTYIAVSCELFIIQSTNDA